jgi:hypothetical protein
LTRARAEFGESNAMSDTNENVGTDRDRRAGASLGVGATDQISTSQLDHIRAEIRAEINLLNSRLNALISSQSFLVIAYGSSLSAGYDDWNGLFTITLPPLFAVLALLLVLEARPGIEAAHQAIGHWRRREDHLIRNWPELEPFTLATDEQSRRDMELRQHAGGLFSIRAPLIFTISWLVFLALPFVLRVWG